MSLDGAPEYASESGRAEGGQMRMKIGELAKMTGCEVVTIRYYEKEGLLKAPERTAGNYRMYGDAELARLRFIRHCRRHGMSLAEIRSLLAFSDAPEGTCDWIKELIRQHVRNIETQIHDLKLLKRHLEGLYQVCDGGRQRECGILKSLSDGEHCTYCSKRNGAHPCLGSEP